jgi:hypothetical protein
MAEICDADQGVVGHVAVAFDVRGEPDEIADDRDRPRWRTEGIVGPDIPRATRPAIARLDVPCV